MSELLIPIVSDTSKQHYTIKSELLIPIVSETRQPQETGFALTEPEPTSLQHFQFSVDSCDLVESREPQVNTTIAQIP